MAIKKVELSWITVSDIAKAKELFVDILGFEVRSYEEKYGWMELIAPEGGMALGVAQAKPNGECAPEKPGSNAIVTCTVDDIDASIKEFTQKGVTFVGSIIEVPGHVKMITFVDHDGNKFQLVQELSK